MYFVTTEKKINIPLDGAKVAVALQINSARFKVYEVLKYITKFLRKVNIYNANIFIYV